MAEICRHWRMAPADYWALRWDERNALVRHMNREAEQAKKARKAAAAKSKRRRGRR